MSDFKFKKGEEIKLCFNPEAYLKCFYTELDYSILPTLKALHKFLQTGIEGNRLLDISTGPTPHTVIDAAPFVEEIYLSDFIPANRDYLYKWLTGTVSKDYFGPIVRMHTDQCNVEQRWEELVDAIKSKVTGIFPIDLSRDNLMAPNIFPQFDVITSAYAFEVAAANSSSDYALIVKRVSKLLKQGGHLLVCGSLGESFYNFDGNTYHVLPITREFVEKSFGDAGFVLKGWEEVDRLDAPSAGKSDYSGTFVMHLIKN